MNDLALNIEYLLLTHDSVIVPGLGAFHTRAFASRWIEDEELFLPPVRHVRFNADIFQDPADCFLNSLSQIYGISLEEADAKCQGMVADFHKMLVTEGTVDFGSIGLFTLEDDAEITMSSYECGITSPDFYGLDAFHFPLLADDSLQANSLPEILLGDELQEEDGVQQAVEIAMPECQTEEAEAVGAEADNTPKTISVQGPKTYVADDKHIIIRINRTLVHYTMVAAASVLLFFLLSPGVQQQEAAQQVNVATTNYVLPTPAKATPTPAATVQDVSVEAELEEPAEEPVETMIEAPEEESLATETTASDKVEAAVQQTNDNNVVFSQLRGQYCIVLASAISQKNASAFITRLEAKDIHAIMYHNGKLLRVVIDGFDTQADAYNMNSYLHKMDNELSSTWVMKN